MIALETRFGTIRIELDFDKAPLSARNFQDYVERGFYDGTLFHRVIDGFMIQGGGFSSGLNGKKGRGPIRNEADNGLKNRAGTLAMARTADPHSASSQFFINVADNDFLDHRDKTPAAGATPFSARSSRAWMSSTRSSAASRFPGAGMAMCR